MPKLRRKPTVLGFLLLALSVIALAVTPQVNVTAQTNGTPTPLPLFALPDARFNPAHTSGSLAVASDGRTMATANFLNNTMTLLIPAFDRVLAEIPVGNDPRGVTFTADVTRALVTNRLDGTLSVVDVTTQTVSAVIPLGGALPYGVITDNNRFAYVTLQGSDAVVVVDLDALSVTDIIPTPDAPAGLALWGDFLYVTHFWSGELSLIYLPSRSVIQTVPTSADAGLFQAIEPDITRGIAYLPQTRLNAQNTALTYDTIAFPVVNVVNLRDFALERDNRIALAVADRPVNMPFALALDRFAQRLYVANAGSDSVSVIDLNTGLARAHIPVGVNPRALRLSRDNTLLYVHNALDGTVMTVSTDDYAIVDVLPVIDLTLSIDLLIGAELFHTARDPRLSADGWLSCATCHFDGLSDGRVWQGFDDGPRNTPLLYALPETVPYNWSGTWDELADIELKIRDLHAGLGLIDAETVPPALGEPHFGTSDDLDLLTSYLTSLQPPANPNRFPQRVLARGRAVFEEQECAACHVGPAGTNLQRYDVGTGLSPLEERGTAFDTPSLRWLWLSAPYFHDGSAPTLRDVFVQPGEHQLIYDVSPEDIDALVAYLLSLPQE